jgi:Competence protein.
VLNFAIGFFVAMTGADGPVLRAAVMGGIAGFGVATGRPAGAKNLFIVGRNFGHD